LLYHCLHPKKRANSSEFCKNDCWSRGGAEDGEAKHAPPRPNIAHFRLPKTHITQKEDRDHDGMLQISSRAPFWIELVANAIDARKMALFLGSPEKVSRGSEFEKCQDV
jgi:hypothetical protein